METVDNGWAPGTPMRGNPAGMPACGTCTHVHRVTDSIAPSGITLTYEVACFCGCTVSGADYLRGVVTVADISTFDSTHATTDHDDDGPSFGPRALADAPRVELGGLRSGRVEHEHGGLGVHSDLGIGGQLLRFCGGLWLRGCQLLLNAAIPAGRLRVGDLSAQRGPLLGGVERQVHGVDGAEVTA